MTGLARAARRSCLALVGALLFAPADAGAGAGGAQADLQPAEIVSRALENNTFSASNATAEVNLQVFRDGKPIRERRMLTRVRRDPGGIRAFVEFQSPADVAGTRFLSFQKRGEIADQYIFLPAFRKVKRVIGAERSSSFMGTDFSYADLDGREVEAANWRRMPDQAVAGQDCFVVEGLPKNPNVDSYGRSVVWVHKEHFVPMRIEFYDRDERTLKKTLVVHRLERKGGRWLAAESEMETPRKGTKTRLSLGDVDFATRIPDEALSQRALER